MSRHKLNSFLIIDDEEANEFITRTFLERANCVEEIVSVNDPRDGLSVLERNEMPEVIIVDINMPGMNAWRFLEEARKVMGNGSFPFVVILSSSVSIEDKEAAASHQDVKMFVSKPLNPDKVNEILDQYFAAYPS
ncbi:MAG: response regulator [Cytophagales bacterium]|nr:response regulator [Cytophagales bacterium]